MMADWLVRLEIQALFDAYCDCLDNDRLEEWPGFFVADCLYEIIPKENVDAGLPAPLIHCDNQRMLHDRVVSLRNANIFSPVLYRHFLSAIIWQRDAADLVVRSNYLVVNTSPLGESSVYQTGRYEDRLTATDSGWRFKSRRVVYDTARVQTLLAIPI
jgi:anthranilate 1,2-dioxygenase small subunit